VTPSEKKIPCSADSDGRTPIQRGIHRKDHFVDLDLTIGSIEIGGRTFLNSADSPCVPSAPVPVDLLSLAHCSLLDDGDGQVPFRFQSGSAS
jgi:hypothetical protein